MQYSPSDSSYLLDQPITARLKLNWTFSLFILLLLAAFFTRFYKLEYRVMSHDETSHVYFSWLLSTGKGYAHDPVTHGPFQFHIVALSYFLFGASDTSARIPAVLFNIATIAFTWNFRRYLGKAGALIAGLMLLISPFILYYGRYVRNESFVGLYFMATIWAILRFYETGEKKYMYFLTLANVLHFATKETSFIYAAQMLLFAGLFFIYQITSKSWKDPNARLRFIGFLILALILFGTAIFYHEFIYQPNSPSAVIVEGDKIPPTAASPLTIALFSISTVSIIGALYFLYKGFGSENLRQDRSFSLMLLQFLLVIPLLAPFVINYIGWKIPVNANEVNALTSTDILKMTAVILPSFAISIVIGLWWNKREWLINSGIFWSIFIVLYTTFFTNGPGFFTGLVGSLGYWLAQQDVQRGSQPFYYYLLIQIPLYEFLPAFGIVIAFISKFNQIISFERKSSDGIQAEMSTLQAQSSNSPTFALLAFWTVTSVIAYSIAGEKMPWLTYHIALPMILLSGWGINALIETTNWNELRKGNTWLALILVPVFVASLASVMTSLLASPQRPFQGRSLEELAATSTLIISLLVTIGSAVLISTLLKNWLLGQIFRFFALSVLGLLTLLTARASFRASYVNGDEAKEYLVYAHSGPGVKIALNQIEDISRRTTGSLDMEIAYDNETTYPYWWYLRDFTNQKYFGSQPTREQLRDVPVILVGDNNASKIEPIVGQAYDRFDYIRIWWPNQDYYDLTKERILNAISNPEMRAAIFKIWLNRDFTDYARITNSNSFSLSTWQPSQKFRLYVRKDIIAKVWQFGSVPQEGTIVADPYEGKGINLAADVSLNGSDLSIPFSKPRAIAVAPDGSLYIADSGNHRILHFGNDLKLLNTWGQFGDINSGSASPGRFNEPWGIAVGLDGSVYVADTWNHRIQKFTAEGIFIKSWGSFGQAERPDGFWGPRAILVDQLNHVYVTDTGNKRIVIFDSEGNYINQFGQPGALLGEFDEPVGMAFDEDGNIFIADTWNQRIQKFEVQQSGTFLANKEWPIVGWYGQSLDNKPYLTFNKQGRLFASDPEGYRILEFLANGSFFRYWGDAGSGPEDLNLPTGIAFDNIGGIWVADTGNNRIQHFTLPPDQQETP